MFAICALSVWHVETLLLRLTGEATVRPCPRHHCGQTQRQRGWRTAKILHIHPRAQISDMSERGHRITMSLRKVTVFLSCVVGVLPLLAWAEEDHTSEKLLSVFYPYRQSLPQAAGIYPGMKIDRTNFLEARAVLPPEILTYVQHGDFAFTVQKTTDMPLRESFIRATIAHYDRVELGDGELKQYVAGLPFPLIDAHDPRAGEKVMWNQRYRDRGETVQFWPTNIIRDSSGAAIRFQRFHFAARYGMHRPVEKANSPQWEQQGIYSKQYTRMVAPSDIEGNQVLSFTYDKDVIPDDQWIFDPKSRRTRKVVYNPYQAAGDGVLLIEDRSGFSGYIHAYDWQYLGERVLLVPGPTKAPEATWGGRGNWYPVDPWELRRVAVVEGKPKETHPIYSRRVLYIDLQTYNACYAFAYDHEGKHIRTFLMTYFHPEFNPWNDGEWIPQIASQASIDYPQERASIFETHKTVYNVPLSETRWFSVMSLMLYGK